jgi:hypothetical protein
VKRFLPAVIVVPRRRYHGEMKDGVTRFEAVAPAYYVEVRGGSGARLIEKACTTKEEAELIAAWTRAVLALATWDPA